MATLVLGSTSRFRRALFERVGLAITCIAPEFDENGEAHLAPRERAAAFAFGKAHSVAARVAREGARTFGFDDRPWFGIAADQALEFDGVMLRKPHDHAAMVAQLSALAGHTHYLHSAVTVFAARCDFNPGNTDSNDRDSARPWAVTYQSFVTTVTLQMRALTPTQIAQYIALDNPEGAVGAYLYEQRGILLMDEVTGGDDSAIVGLPLIPTLCALRHLGFDALDAAR